MKTKYPALDLAKVDKTCMYGSLIGGSPSSMLPLNEVLKLAKRSEHLRGRFFLYFDDEKHGKLTDN